MEPIKELKDSFSFVLRDKDTLKRIRKSVDAFKDAEKPMGLEVIIDATHGGYINLNNSFYTLDGMRAGYKSWFIPYPKPVLEEHDDGNSPIGRVYDAEYIDLATTADDIVAGGLRGAPKGKIRVKAVISDPEAIQKFLDGRYMTVSMYGRPKTPVICSICEEQMSMMGCNNDHIPGQVYDGKMCAKLVGELGYAELSVVNKPADQSNVHAAIVVSVKPVEVPTMTDSAKQAMENALASVKKEDEVVVADSVNVESECPECEDGFWTDAELEEVDELGDGYRTWFDKDQKDAKLSAAQRKKLPDNAFCGPGRSFPVPDMAHVVAAKRLLERSKYSESTKAKISACVNRKEKQLKKNSSDNVQDNVFTPEETTKLNEFLTKISEFLSTNKVSEDKIIKDEDYIDPEKKLLVVDAKFGAELKVKVTESDLTDELKAKLIAAIDEKLANLPVVEEKKDENPVVDETTDIPSIEEPTKEDKPEDNDAKEEKDEAKEIEEGAIALLNEVKTTLLSEIKSLTEGKKIAEDNLKLATTKTEDILAQLEAAQEEIRQVKAELAEAVVQHTTDLDQNKTLTASYKDALIKNIALSSIILGKDSFIEVFKGSKAEDRVNAYEIKTKEYRDLSMETITAKDKELFDELTRKTLVSSPVQAQDSLEDDQIIVQKVQTLKDRTQSLRRFFNTKK